MESSQAKPSKSDQKDKPKTGLPKRLFDVEEAASYLGISRRTLYNGIAPRSKKPFPVKPKRIGKKVLFDIKDLDQFIEDPD